MFVNVKLEGSTFTYCLCLIIIILSSFHVYLCFQEENKDAVCDELIQKWDEISNMDSKQTEESAKTAIDDRLSQMLSTTHVTSNNNTDKKGKELSEEEKARKAAILAQYSTVCDEPDLIDGEGVEDIAEAGKVAPSSTVGSIAASAASTIPGLTYTNLGLTQNQNKENVYKREKDQRDKMKQENEKKKEKDKQDRETQKNKKQDRKDLEKKRTQKGERRR